MALGCLLGDVCITVVAGIALRFRRNTKTVTEGLQSCSKFYYTSLLYAISFNNSCCISTANQLCLHSTASKSVVLDILLFGVVNIISEVSERTSSRIHQTFASPLTFPAYLTPPHSGKCNILSSLSIYFRTNPCLATNKAAVVSPF